MSTPLPSLEFALASNPLSGTGSDLYDQGQDVRFGAILVGSSQEKPFMQSLIRDAAMAVAVALILKTVVGKL